MSVAQLMVQIGGSASQLLQSLAQAQQGLQALNDEMESMQQASALVTGAVAAAAAAFAGLAVAGVQGMAEAETAMAKTEAVIRSTGAVAGVAADHVAELAGKMEVMSGMAAESVQQGANLLLTFTNIRNVAGQGNDVFDQTVAIMADMAAMMGTDAAGAAMQLGKALNDPVAGIAALSRSGVSFSQSQKDMIKSLVETNRVVEAQRMILAELNKEFGGQAEAMGKTFAGAMERVLNALGDVGEAMAAPIFEPLVNVLNMTQAALLSLAESIGQKGLVGALLDILAPTEAARLALVSFTGAIIAMMIPSIVSAITALAALVSSFAAIAPLAARGAAVALVAYAIYQAWGPLADFFTSTWRQVNEATQASVGYISSSVDDIVARAQYMGHLVPRLIGVGFDLARSFVQRIMASITLIVHQDIQAISQLFGFLPQTMLAAFNRAISFADKYFVQPIMSVLRTVAKGFSEFGKWLGVTFPSQALAGLGSIGKSVAGFAAGVADAVVSPFRDGYRAVSGFVGRITATTNRARMPVGLAAPPTIDIQAAGKASKAAASGAKALADAHRAAAQSMADENLALKSLTDAQRAQIQAAQQYGQALTEAQAKQALFGDSIETTQALIQATERTMVALVSNGMDPASEQIAYLRFQVQDLTDGLKRQQLASLGSTAETGKAATATTKAADATKESASALDIAQASIRGAQQVLRELGDVLGDTTAQWVDFGLEAANAGVGIASAFAAGPIVGTIAAIAGGLALLTKGGVMAWKQITQAEREANEEAIKAGKESLDAIKKVEDGVQSLGRAYTDTIMAAQMAGRSLTLDELQGAFDDATKAMLQMRADGVDPLSDSYRALQRIQGDIEVQFRAVANSSAQTALAFRAVGGAGEDAARRMSGLIDAANSAVESAGSAIGDYLGAAADEMDLSRFEASFSDAIRKAVMSAVEKAITASIVAKGAISTLIQALQGELAAGRMGAAEALIPKIAQQAEAEARRVGPVIDRLRGAIDSAFTPGKGTKGPADIVAPIQEQAQEIRKTVDDIKKATQELRPEVAARPGQISAYLPQGRESRQVVINITGNTVLNDRDADRLGNALVGSMRRAGVAL